MERAHLKQPSLDSLDKFEQFEAWLTEHGAQLDSVCMGVRSDDAHFMKQVTNCSSIVRN
jgi:hypothetical protein